MVVELKEKPQDDQDLEQLVTRVFFKGIDLLGGLNKLAEYRTLTWLPSLARASFAIVLKDEYFRTEEEIAESIGLTKNTVRNILRADSEMALYKIKHIEELTKEEKNELKIHTAGGLAKLAYKLVKEGQDAQIILEFCATTGAKIAKVFEIPWVYSVLKRMKGVKYPIQSPESLEEKLTGIDIKGIPATDIIKKLTYPINSPAIFLHKIKEHLIEKKG